MSEIEELSSRILSAMDRVAAGLDAVGQVDASETEALKAALEAEKQVNAELTERVRVIGERQEQAVAAMEGKAVAAQERLKALDMELQQVRAAHEMLAEASDALRQANAEGVGDADLINATMQAELEATRSMRRAELAEADEIIAGLMPLLTVSNTAQATQETQ